jgi:hypothetical protein
MAEQKLIRWEICNTELKFKNWSTHLKSQTHLESHPDQTVKPFEHTKLCEKMQCKSNTQRMGCTSKGSMASIKRT